MKFIIQKIIDLYPTHLIPQNKILRFFFKIIYFSIRNFFSSPFIIQTSFFKIYAYPKKKESASIYFRGFHEFDFIKKINHLYKVNSRILFLDIGANVGNNTLAAAKHYHNIECHSFEPSPKYFYQLNANIKLNNLDNVKTYNFCIGQNNSEIDFFVDLNNPGGSTAHENHLSFHPNLLKPKFEKIKTKVKSLDFFLNDINTNDFNNFFIKIDVEGNEKYVLEGAANFINKHSPDMILEIEERNFADSFDISQKLISLSNQGYFFYKNFTDEVNIKNDLKMFFDYIEKKKHFHFDYFISKKKHVF